MQSLLGVDVPCPVQGCTPPDQVTQRLEPGFHLDVAFPVVSTVDMPNNCPQPAAVFTGLPVHFHQPRVAASQGPEWPSGPLRPTSCQGDTSAPLASSPSSYLCPGGPGPLPRPALLPRNGRRKADHFPPSWEPPAPVQPPGPGEADRE